MTVVYEFDTHQSGGVLTSDVNNVSGRYVRTRLVGTENPNDHQSLQRHFDLEIKHDGPGMSDPVTSPFDPTKVYRVTIEEVV